VKYEIRRANEWAWGPDGPWEVMRCLRLGEKYVVGVFEDLKDANDLMRILEKSIDLQTWEAGNGKRQSICKAPGGEDEEGGYPAA
jgi:hypothetical protein